jgi:spermidine synthase
MAFLDSSRRALALASAGAVVFGAPALLQPVLAPSWGAGPTQIAALLALNLAAGALGASIVRVPGWIAAAAFAAVLASPWTSWALASASVLPACALVFFASACAARWSTSILAHAPRERHLWYALETAGGCIGVLGLLVWGFAHLELPELARVGGILAAAGAVLSIRLERASTVPASPADRALPLRFSPALLLSAWSGFQFFHAEVAWTHRFAQAHPNSTTAFGVVALAMLVGIPLGSLVARRIPDLRLLSLASLAGWLLLPLLQGGLVDNFGRTLALETFPWDLLFASLVALVPAAASASLLFPWLVARAAQPRDVAALVAANLVGGLLGASAAGLVTLPLAGLQTVLWLPSIGWALLAVGAAKAGRQRWIAAPISILLLGAAWALWSGALKPRPDYVVLDRAEGWSGRVEFVERGDHTYLVYNGSYALGGTRSVASQSWQAGLAMALRPQARDVFVLGLGTGITASALTRSTSLRHARVVELLPQVVTLARRHFGPWTGPLFSDPRFQIEVGDARTALRDDTARYDLVLGDLFLPWLPGAELLMGREHFASVRDHLRPGGLFVQWLPLYQLTEPVLNDILATAGSVFGDVHIFRENHDPSAPMIALVAAAPGSDVGTHGVAPEIAVLWTGSTSGMTSLAEIPPWSHGNRLKRGIASGGRNPGQPPASLALAGHVYVDWVTRIFRERFPDSTSPLGSLGPEAWRHAARGFFLLHETASRQRGDFALADTFAVRARFFLPDTAPAEERSRI